MEYSLYQSKTILNNHSRFINDCYIAQDKFKNVFASDDSTWYYQKYNIFNLTSTNILFYRLFNELRYHIRSYIGDNRPLWFQSWLNFHSSDEVLEKHSHDWPHHGYISIDPKYTTTVFDKYEIQNLPGQIYIGPGGDGYQHYVRVDKPFEGKRITIGFDIEDKKDTLTPYLGLIPLI
jgi:hypothetical protein